VTRPVKRERASHATVAAQAKAHPGEWVRVGAYSSRACATVAAWAIRDGRGPSRTHAYAPAGAFETRTEDREFDTEVYTRFRTEAAAS
jgi:hypothetical protein